MTIDPAYAAGIDVGGTSVKALVFDAENNLVDQRRAATVVPDPTGQKTVDTVADLVTQLDIGSQVPLGVVVPGIVDEATGTAVLAVNTGYDNAPMKRLLEEKLGRPVAFGHDLRAGALAETISASAGEEPAPKTEIFVAVGTGIAAGIVVDGEPVASQGWAGEIGQVVIPYGPMAGRTMEQIASASAIAKACNAPDAKTVAQRVAAADAEATAVWENAIGVLGHALGWLSAALGPERIIIGGGLVQAGDLLMAPLRTSLQESLQNIRTPELVPAIHGDKAGALGAAQMGRREMADG